MYTTEWCTIEYLMYVRTYVWYLIYTLLLWRGGAESVPRPPAPSGPAHPKGRIQLLPDCFQRGLHCSNRHHTTSGSGSRGNRRRGSRRRRGDWTQHWLLQGEGLVVTECGGSVQEYSWSHDMLVVLMTCMRMRGWRHSVIAKCFSLAIYS